MKASVTALVVGLVAAGGAGAQSPVFTRGEEPPASLPIAAPPLPALPSSLKEAPATGRGAQLQGAVPAPPVTTLPAPQAADLEKWAPPTPKALVAPYLADPDFTPPERDPNAGPIPDLTGGRTGPHVWFAADTLLWVVKRGPQPDPLIVTGPASDPFPGALDQPNTSVIYGGRGLDYRLFAGVRLNTGVWFGKDGRFGFEAGGFLLEQKSTSFDAAGDANGQPYFGRPFVNARSGFENVYFVSQNFADPNLSAMMTGGLHISSQSRLWGWDLNGLWNVSRGDAVATNLIAGFRSVGLREQLDFTESLRNLAPGGGVSFGGVPVDPANSVATFDKFRAENNFYGGQLGARWHFERDRLGIDITGKAAIGVVQQLMIVEGGTYLYDNTGHVVGGLPGGVLAQTSNIGRHYRNVFGVVPEGSLNFSYALTDQIILRAGYTFIYINNVVRPGNHIDRTINPGLVPTDLDYGTAGGPSHPAFQFHSSSFWAQGANIGLEVRF
jgi:hypothetical protein